MARQITSLTFFRHEQNTRAAAWEKKIRAWLKTHAPRVGIIETPTLRTRPRAVIAIGGDGTILDAARKFQKYNAVILGLNLGAVGFLASVRAPKHFLPSLKRFLAGTYTIAERMMLAVSVERGGKKVFGCNPLNEVAIQNPLGMVELEVCIEAHPLQHIRGTGMLIATATGSTAYNLSAHGPILEPNIQGFILTELMDHNIPTPSVVVKKNREVAVRVKDFREKGTLRIARTNEPADLLLIADGENIFPLKKNDWIRVRRSPRLVRFAELEPHYFFKSLQEKFSFK